MAKICWRSCVHIPLDHRTIRIMQIQKRHVSRGPQPIQNARFGPSRFHLLGFPGLHRNRGTFHKKFLNAFESEVPLEVEFPEDMFFFLGDQGTLLVKNGGGCTIQLCIQYMYYTRLI